MSYSTFHPLAAQELREAAALLARQRPEQGGEFLDAVLATAERARQLPFSGTPGEADTRRAQIAGFAYALVYIIRRDGLRIIAIAHQRGHPAHWRARTG